LNKLTDVGIYLLVSHGIGGDALVGDTLTSLEDGVIHITVVIGFETLATVPDISTCAVELVVCIASRTER
jgi:hypothetical protein